MQKTASGKVYFQPDLYGSILSVSDGQGQSLGYSEWDVRGNVKFHGQGRTPLPEGGGNPCFTSYIPDPVIGKHFAQARFYDPAHGRMLAPDPVKRGLNGYPYCSNDPVNYVDPTGEVASILAGGILGGIMEGTFGFAGSAISQIVGGKEFDVREALGAGASGMVVGAVRGALIGSGAGLPVPLVSDFTAGTVGSTLEQLITGGKANAGKSIAGGLINAVSGAIYGNNPLGSLKEAFIKGAKAGAATSGINYLSEVFGGQKEDGRNGTLRGSLGLVPFGRTNDPRRGCMARDPFGGMTEGGSDYGYQYQIPRRERTVRKAPERFSLAEFGREIVTGFVMGGLSSAAFYGDGRAVEAVKRSVRSVYEGGTGVLDNANYAQKTYSDTFSAEGRKIYSGLAGEPINTIDDLVNAIISGKVNVADLSVEYIVRDGNILILNTRTSQALTQAGIPRSQWNAINRTGEALFEELLTGQLSRNKLTSEGISTVRPSGGQ